MAGDTDHSKTKEYQYTIGDETWKNETTRKVLKGDMDAVYSKLCDDSDRLSGGVDAIPVQVFQNIYELCLEETGDVDSFIDHYEEGMSQFTNNRKKYNGCFYCYYISEIDDEIAKETLFIVKRK